MVCFRLSYPFLVGGFTVRPLIWLPCSLAQTMLLFCWGADAQLLLVNIGERSFLAVYSSGFVLSRGRCGCECGDVVFAGPLLDPLLAQLL